MPVKVTVNGAETKDFNEKEIIIKEFPAEIAICY
jgi:hypothetical protein